MTVKIYKVESSKISAVRQAMSADHWARNGYTLRAGKALGFDGDEHFLYVDGPEDFLNEHEAEVKVEGVTEVTGDEFNKVKEAIDKEENSVATGIALFD